MGSIGMRLLASGSDGYKVFGIVFEESDGFASRNPLELMVEYD